MNYKLISDHERTARKRARKQKEHRRLNSKRSKLRSVRRRAEIRSQLTLEGVIADKMSPVPHGPPLLLANAREARKDVRRLHDVACFSRWRDPTMPVQEILAMAKFTDIKWPEKIIRPLETDISARSVLAVQSTDQVGRLLKALGSWSLFDPTTGALAWCPHCREFQLKVTIRTGEDAIWQCFECKRPPCATWPFIMHLGGRAFRALAIAVERHIGNLTQEQVGAAFPAYVAEAAMVEAQHVNEGRVLDKLLQPAFGYWGVVPGNLVDGTTGFAAFPGLPTIKHKGYLRDEYLVRLCWNRWGQASRLDFHSTRYVPLFRYHLGDPTEACFEASSWAMRRQWKKVIVTYDRAEAAHAEDEQRGLPRDELTPVLLLDPGVELEKIGLRALERRSETGCLLAEPEVHCFQSPSRILYPPCWEEHLQKREPPLRVLFVDRTGSGLARMAAAWLLQPGSEKRFEASSASMELGRLNFGAVAAMAERNREIAVEARRTVDALVEAGAEFDHIILVSDGTYLSPFVTLGGATMTTWSFYEPPVEDGPWDLDALRELRDRLLDQVSKWADQVRPKSPPAPPEKSWVERYYEENGRGFLPKCFDPPPPEPLGPKPFLKTDFWQCTWSL